MPGQLLSRQAVLAGAREPCSIARFAARLIEDALGCGACLLAGGGRPAGFDKDYYFASTVLADVPQTAAIMQVEPFAPVAPLAPFETFDDAIRLANSTPTALPATCSRVR